MLVLPDTIGTDQHLSGFAATERLGDKIESISQRNAHESPQKLKQPQLSRRDFRAVEVRISDAEAAGAREASDTEASDTEASDTEASDTEASDRGP